MTRAERQRQAAWYALSSEERERERRDLERARRLFREAGREPPPWTREPPGPTITEMGEDL